MAIDFLSMFSALRVGVDLLPDTLLEDAPEVQEPGYTPYYAVQVERNGVWEDHVPHVTPDQLPTVVEAMHWDYTEPVRLLESGHPVFSCYTA